MHDDAVGPAEGAEAGVDDVDDVDGPVDGAELGAAGSAGVDDVDGPVDGAVDGAAGPAGVDDVDGTELGAVDDEALSGPVDGGQAGAAGVEDVDGPVDGGQAGAAEVEDVDDVEQTEQVEDVDGPADGAERSAVVGEAPGGPVDGGQVGHVEQVEDVEQTERVEDVEQVGHVEQAGDVERVEDVEQVGHVDDVEQAEEVEDVDDVEQVEQVEDIEDVEDVENVDGPVDGAELGAVDDEAPSGPVGDAGTDTLTADPASVDVGDREAPSVMPTAAPDADEAASPAEETRWSRWGALVVLAAALLGTIVTAVVVGRNEGGPAPKPDVPLDAWAPYWALEDSAPELTRRARSMREVSPFWFNVTGVDEITVDPNASETLTESFLEDARRSDALVVPSLVDALPAGRMAAILGDPVLRRRHVQTIVEFAEEGDYDGIDLDYEQFAFADGRSTWASTRSAWVTFVEQLADELHADGRTLTVSIPPVYDAERTADSGYWVYDYGAISEHVDRIRIMAYDYSVSEPGPIAPLPWVERAVAGAVEASGRPDKLVLGLPAYGRNWPVGVSGECPDGVEVPGQTSVTTRTVDELLERREAEPVFDPRTAEWTFDYEIELTDGEATCVQSRQVHYVDGEGVRQRMDLALEYGLGGVSLWALGFEDDDVWDHILPTVSDSSSRDGGVDTVVGQGGAGDG